MFVEAPRSEVSGTVLLVHQSDSGTLHASVHRPDAALFFRELARTPPGFLWVEFEDEPLSLGLDYGPLTLPAPGEDSRDPPAPARAFVSRDGAPFLPLNLNELAEDPRWSALRLPAFNPVFCLRQGACPRGGRCDPDCVPPVRELPQPDRPRLGCPVGWRRGSLDDLSGHELELLPELASFEVCRPSWPEQECGPGNATFGDEPACEPLGDCALEWPLGLPAETIYVRADAPSGGDGSREAPLRTLGEARDLQPNASHLALHGRLDLDVALDWTQGATVSLSGACASRDQLAWRAPHRLSVPVGGKLRVYGLRLEVLGRGETWVPSLELGPGQRLELEAMEFDDSSASPGVYLRSATASLRRVRLRAARGAPHVLWIEGESRVEAEHVSVEGGEVSALMAWRNGTPGVPSLRLSHVTLRGRSLGLQATEAEIEAHALGIDAPVGASLVEVVGALDRVYVRYVPPLDPVPVGPRFFAGGAMELGGLFVESAGDRAARSEAVVFIAAGTIRLSDAVVDARGMKHGLAFSSGQAQAERVLIIGGDTALSTESSGVEVSHLTVVTAGAQGLYLDVSGEYSSPPRISDVLVAGFSRLGVRVISPGWGLSRVAVRDGAGHGISLRDEGATIEDVLVSDIAGGAFALGAKGSGLVLDGHAVQATNVSIRRCELAGVLLLAGGVPTFRGLDIRDVPTAIISALPASEAAGVWEASFVCGADQLMTDVDGSPLGGVAGGAPPCPPDPRP